eukprot:7482485-Prorocentrum_lima.AAC.1
MTCSSFATRQAPIGPSGLMVLGHPTGGTNMAVLRPSSAAAGTETKVKATLWPLGLLPPPPASPTLKRAL